MASNTLEGEARLWFPRTARAVAAASALPAVAASLVRLYGASSFPLCRGVGGGGGDGGAGSRPGSERHVFPGKTCDCVTARDPARSCS